MQLWYSIPMKMCIPPHTRLLHKSIVLLLFFKKWGKKLKYSARRENRHDCTAEGHTPALERSSPFGQPKPRQSIILDKLFNGLYHQICRTTQARIILIYKIHFKLAMWMEAGVGTSQSFESYHMLWLETWVQVPTRS